MPFRVNVPRSTSALFVDRDGSGGPPRASLTAVAETLGFQNVEELRSAVIPSWPGWTPKGAVYAAEFVALMQVLQFKSRAAERLLKDIMLDGATRVVSLPSEPLDAPSVAHRETNGDAPDDPIVSPSPLGDFGDKDQRDPWNTSLKAPPWVMCAPEDVGMDREPLEKCRRYLHYRIGRKHFSGIVGGVVKNGKLVYFDEAGYADLATKTPMRQDTIMRLFSMTKCIVVVAFLAYAEDPSFGVDLDDPVAKYIPSFKKITVAPKRGSTKPRELEKAVFEVKGADGKVVREKLPVAPTLRQLLTHTAGLGYGPTLGDHWPPRSTDHYKIYCDLLQKADAGQLSSLAEWVDELAKIPLKVTPGSYWEYSFATDVLGRVLEVISGLPLDKVVEQKVCGPLGMVDTTFLVPPEKASRMAAWYEKKPPTDDKGNPLEKIAPGATYNLQVVDKPGKDSGWVGSRCSKILSAGGAIELPLSIKGGMVSTFRDYLRFLLMIRNHGELDGVRVLRRETVQTMICNQVPVATRRRCAWVFDKKGQGYNFIGQIQVQHNEKDTFQEKGVVRRGNTVYASLTPGTVSAEFGWGGLGGPAWTIDPRSDLIVLSMTQTALELDHEENLRFSARRAIHAGIFGPTAGPMKVTDYPPEFHEGLRKGKLDAGLEKARSADFDRPTPSKAKPDAEMELEMFMEAEQEAKQRAKTLKELAVAVGNAGHEVHEEEEDAEIDESRGNESRSVDSARKRGDGVGVSFATAKRLLRRNPSNTTTSSVGSGHGQKRQLGTDPGLGERGEVEQEPETAEPTKPKRTKTPRKLEVSPGKLEASPAKKDVPTASKSDVSPQPTSILAISPAKQNQGSMSPRSSISSAKQNQGALSPQMADGGQELLFSRVRVGPAQMEKARVTAVKGDEVEVVTEGSWREMNVSIDEVTPIDESHAPLSNVSKSDPKDFGFLLQKVPDPSSPSRSKGVRVHTKESA